MNKATALTIQAACMLFLATLCWGAYTGGFHLLALFAAMCFGLGVPFVVATYFVGRK